MHYHYILGATNDQPDVEGMADTYDDAFQALVERADLTVEDPEWFILYASGFANLEGELNAEITECDALCNPDDYTDM